MTREVLETDNEGRAVVVVYRESDDERRDDPDDVSAHHGPAPG